MAGSVDELKRDAAAGRRTMGYVKPLEIRGFSIERRSASELAWSQRQAALLGRQSLFGPSLEPLERIPYRFYYEFICPDTACVTVHRMQVLDWEIHQSYRKWLPSTARWDGRRRSERSTSAGS